MIKMFFIIMWLFPTILFSQRIKEDEVDKFNGLRRMTTTTECVKNGMLEMVCFWYRSADTALFLNLKARGWGTGVVGEGDRLILLLENKELVTVVSTGIQTYQVGKYGSSYDHQYRITKVDAEKLCVSKVVSIRRYSDKNYSDLDIPAHNQDAVKNLSIIFLNAFDKKGTK